MDAITVIGGQRLEGDICIGGSKNAALPLMIASLLSDETLILRNVPDLLDVSLLARILIKLGVEVSFQKGAGDERVCILRASHIASTMAPYDLVSRMRASFWVVGPLLARCREACVSLPGGCAIGMRPVDLYIMALEKLGVQTNIEDGYVIASAPKGLAGGHIVFPKVTVGVTHTVIMAAVLAKGQTIIENAACEPEVGNLIACLNKMGAKIKAIGSSCLEIEGVDRLYAAECEVIPDRIEVGTYAFATIAAGGDVVLRRTQSKDLGSVIDVIRRIGGEIIPSNGEVRVRHNRGSLRPVHVHTSPFPGFPTDLQAQLMALMVLAHGTSTIHETIFENRFMHVQELARLGADITLAGQLATIRGPRLLKGAQVMATDLRASACLIIAGLAAEGATTVSRIYHLDRGFERIEEKLGRVGAKIQRHAISADGSATICDERRGMAVF